VIVLAFAYEDLQLVTLRKFILMFLELLLPTLVASAKVPVAMATGRNAPVAIISSKQTGIFWNTASPE
jgi:hypothetical protein